MNVLFIYVDCNSLIFPPHYSVGIGSLSAVLKQHGHHTELVYYTGPDKIEEVFQKIATSEPDIIGFSSMTAGFGNVRTVSNLIKNQYPQSFIICGGIHPTLTPTCLRETPSLDAICRGEGEYPLLYLLEALKDEKDYTTTPSFWFRQGKTIIQNPVLPVIENLDELPLPDREIFQYESVIQHYYGRVGEFLFCRGCPFDCTYCTNTALKKIYPGKYVRYPSVQRAITELVDVTTRYKLDSVAIHDDTITLNKKWFYAFFEEYKRQIDLPFVCQTRVGTCDRDMMRMMKEAGCWRLIIGIESGNEYIRNKILNRNMTNTQILETFQMAHEEGLQTRSQNMIGLPEETPACFVETIRLVAATESDPPGGEPFVSIFHPYEGTRLYELCKEQCLLLPHTLPDDFKERTNSILHLPHFRKKDILYYQKHFACFVSRERKVLKQKICLERLLPPYPQYFRLIAWHEALKHFFYNTLISAIVQQLRNFRICGLCILKHYCGETLYNHLKSMFHRFTP